MVAKSMMLAGGLVIVAIFLSVAVDLQPHATPNYEELALECDEQTTEEYKACCLASVETMRERLAFPIKGNDCPVHFTFDSQQCLGSFQWCEREKALQQ